ncbi:MAG: FkbM family methyltransferase [Acetobacteraceae bacterium]
MLLPMISYAQNGEDVVLRRVFQDRDTGFYVDIGACDPVEDSVTLHFYRAGWRGINVEPDPRYHAALAEQRPRDINLQLAVGRDSETVTYYPTGTRGQGTLDAGMAAERSPAPTRTVSQQPLSRILADHVPPETEIDFLKVDVEGWEEAVLASNDWQAVRPLIILVEAVDARGQPTHFAWEDALLASGYRFALFDGLNRFYCREEDASALLPRLAAPANVLDNWRLGREAAHQETLLRNLTDEQSAHAETRAALAQEQQEHARAAFFLAEERTARATAQDALTSAQTALAAEQAARAAEQRTHADVAVRHDADLAAERSAHAETKAALVTERDLHVQTRQALQETQQAHAAACASLGARDAALAQSRAALAAVHASTSWRITEPLRDLVRLGRVLRRSRSP